MATYSIRKLKASVSQILKAMDGGEEVIITRRGTPCVRLTAMQQPTRAKPSLSTLRGSLHRLPAATYEDFIDIKNLWRPRP